MLEVGELEQCREASAIGLTCYLSTLLALVFVETKGPVCMFQKDLPNGPSDVREHIGTGYK